MSLTANAEQVLHDFQQQAGWEQRARLLLHYANQLVPLAEHEKTTEHAVHGCQSAVWLVLDQANPLSCRISSDARLLRGLFAVLLVRINGLSPAQLSQVDIQAWFSQLGLEKQLSPSRANGLNAVYQAIIQRVQS